MLLNNYQIACYNRRAIAKIPDWIYLLKNNTFFCRVCHNQSKEGREKKKDTSVGERGEGREKE